MSSIIKYEVKDLYEIYRETIKFIQEDYNKLNNFDHVNPFWKNILSKRKNFPSFSEALSFLNNDAAFGLGKRIEGDLDYEQKSYNDAVLALNKLNDKSVLEKFHESLIGFPKFFDEDSTFGSTSFIENLMSTSRVIELVDKYLEKHDKINILEIGAGWGAVIHQLIQYFGDRINSITVCDLHENLFISAFYLQSVFQNKKTTFVGSEKLKTSDNSFIFCPPNNINNLDTEYDLVINMISFQEMNLDVVEGYMRYIKKHLRAGGVFYSENGVPVKNKIGLAQKASDYKYTDYFNVLSLRNGARFCPHLFFGNKHEILLTKNQDTDNAFNPEYLDAVCYLMNFRLDENLIELKEKFVNNKLSDDDIAFLEQILKFMSTENLKDKQKILEQISYKSNNLEFKHFLFGLFYLSQKKYKIAVSNLKLCLDDLTGLVKINILCYIGLVNKGEQKEILNIIRNEAPEMVNTALNVFSTGSNSRLNMSEKISSTLNIKNPSFLGYSLYQWKMIPSIMMVRILNKFDKIILGMIKKRIIPYHLK